MNDLVERMETERHRLDELTKLLRSSKPPYEAVALNIELGSVTIGMWQSEVIRIARENETLKRQLAEVKS